MISPSLRASIDIGSNSVLLLVADFSNHEFKEVLKLSEVTSLGRELDVHQRFHPESIEASYVALKHYFEECERLGVSKKNIIVTATEASRVALNAPEFFTKIENQFGVPVHILSPAAEAYFSTKGILFQPNSDTSFFTEDVVTIIDIGGASTELIRVHTKTSEILETISLPVGAVRSTEWMTQNIFVQKLQKIFLDFRHELDRFQAKKVYCVAGTMTSLANMHLERKDFVEKDVHHLALKVEDIDKLFKKYSAVNPESLLEDFPFLGKRSQNILGGLHLAYHLLHRLLVKNLIISTYGLRYGTIGETKIDKEFLWKK